MTGFLEALLRGDAAGLDQAAIVQGSLCDGLMASCAAPLAAAMPNRTQERPCARSGVTAQPPALPFMARSRLAEERVCASPEGRPRSSHECILG